MSAQEKCPQLPLVHPIAAAIAGTVIGKPGRASEDAAGPGTMSQPATLGATGWHALGGKPRQIAWDCPVLRTGCKSRAAIGMAKGHNGITFLDSCWVQRCPTATAVQLVLLRHDLEQSAPNSAASK
jgi:hypothetical protein